MRAWQELGATHMMVNTMGCGFKNVSEHIDALRRFADFIGVNRTSAAPI